MEPHLTPGHRARFVGQELEEAVEGAAWGTPPALGGIDPLGGLTAFIREAFPLSSCRVAFSSFLISHRIRRGGMELRA